MAIEIPEDLKLMYEASKLDCTQFVGSEIRQLIGRIALLEAKRKPIYVAIGIEDIPILGIQPHEVCEPEELTSEEIVQHCDGLRKHIKKVEAENAELKRTNTWISDKRAMAHYKQRAETAEELVRRLTVVKNGLWEETRRQFRLLAERENEIERLKNSNLISRFMGHDDIDSEIKRLTLERDRNLDFFNTEQSNHAQSIEQWRKDELELASLRAKLTTAREAANALNGFVRYEDWDNPKVVKAWADLAALAATETKEVVNERPIENH